MRAAHKIAWALAVVAAAAGIAVLLRGGAPRQESADVPPGRKLPPPVAAAESVAAAPGAPELAPALPVLGEERHGAQPGPRGRVVASGTGEPLPGITVRLRSPFDTLGETVTASDGSFELPRPDKDRRSVQVVAEGWRAKPASVKLDPEQATGASELLFELERIVAAPLRGTLIDRATGEAVPSFLFQARGPRGKVRKLSSTADTERGEATAEVEFHGAPRRTEDITTDEHGRFESAGGFEAGLLDLVLFDHPQLKPKSFAPDDERAIEHEHVLPEQGGPSEAEIKVAIGPTYRFKLAFPPGLGAADFHALFPLPALGDGGFHRQIAEDPSSPLALLYGGATSGAGIEQRAPLRDDTAPWARFASPILVWPAKEEVSRALHVRSEDGHWAGSATVSSVTGIYPETLSIDLATKGALEGAVLGPGGIAVPSAWIELRRPGEPKALHAIGADRKGSFAIRWVDPGEYELAVLTQRYDPWSSPVSIEGGATGSVEVRLGSAMALGPVAGVLRGRTGQHRSKGGIILLKGLDDPSFFLMKTAQYRKVEGGYAAPFRFDDVPAGSYELTLKPQDNLRWETLRMTISAPAEGLEFVCADDVATLDLGFRAFDAVTGEALASVDSIVWQGDPLQDLRLDNDWETKLYKDVPEGPLRWMARVPGYQIEVGDEQDLRVEDAQRTVEARLTPGFGELFKVTTKASEPLAGVELLVDGELIGATDASGCILLNRAVVPRELAFRRPGWHVSWGTIDPQEIEESIRSGARLGSSINLAPDG